MTKSIAIVLARAGSKGIPNKNIIDLCGKPLIAYTLEALKQSNIDDYFVSTDSEIIANISSQYDSKIIVRPPKLASDFAKSKDALIHAVNSIRLEYEPKNVLLLQPTSPLVTHQDINLILNALIHYDSAITVTENHSFSWVFDGYSLKEKNQIFSDRQPRQKLEKAFIETGSIYGTKYNLLLKNNQILSGKIGYVEIPKSRSFEIDNYEDIFIVESIMKNNNEN